MKEGSTVEDPQVNRAEVRGSCEKARATFGSEAHELREKGEK